MAIVGGGCASIAAAFELTRPEHKGRYQVTVYQQGWRLGGKGASGRGPAARIEEHGFHVWMGMYENAFRLMRECYAELRRDRSKYRIADWRDAFFPAPFIGLAQRTADKKYHRFLSYFPPDGDALPGDPITGNNNPFSVTSYLARIASLLRTILVTILIDTPEHGDVRARVGETLGMRWPNQDRERVAERIERLVKLGLLGSTAGIVEALGLLETIFRSTSRDPDNLTLQLLEATASGARSLLEGILDDDPQMSLVWQAVDLGITAIVGMVRFGLLADPRGFDAINDYDFREWMKLNGASERSIDSPLVRGCYDLVFAYENGDPGKPRHGAGVGLRGSLRLLFSSRGAIFWKMRAGMGDVVFAPFYEVLKRRGVSFKFFHRLKRVRLAPRERLLPAEKNYIAALDFDVQAKTKNGHEYQPLIDLDDLPCWPSSPDYSQIENGHRLEDEGGDFESYWDRRKVGSTTLRVVKDFDFVVLGIGLGAIPSVCQELIQLDRRWREMVNHVATVETQAFQIWLKEGMERVAWEGPPVSLSAFVHPFETWADMGHLIEEERWPTRPGALAYFCSTLRSASERPGIFDQGYPARRADEARRNAIDFLNNYIAKLWPKAARKDGGFRWEMLVDHQSRRSTGPHAAATEARFDSQYWRANVNPSDRYVLSLPGTQKYRISPLDNTYDNLTVAGDWTACGLDTGCVEAAVMSGRLAAHAISSSPALEDIIGYDHP